jgi:hypothetical protein
MLLFELIGGIVDGIIRIYMTLFGISMLPLVVVLLVLSGFLAFKYYKKKKLGKRIY